MFISISLKNISSPDFSLLVLDLAGDAVERLVVLVNDGHVQTVEELLLPVVGRGMGLLVSSAAFVHLSLLWQSGGGRRGEVGGSDLIGVDGDVRRGRLSASSPPASGNKFSPSPTSLRRRHRGSRHFAATGEFPEEFP